MATNWIPLISSSPTVVTKNSTKKKTQEKSFARDSVFGLSILAHCRNMAVSWRGSASSVDMKSSFLGSKMTATQLDWNKHTKTKL